MPVKNSAVLRKSICVSGMSVIVGFQLSTFSYQLLATQQFYELVLKLFYIKKRIFLLTADNCFYFSTFIAITMHPIIADSSKILTTSKGNINPCSDVPSNCMPILATLASVALPVNALNAY